MSFFSVFVCLLCSWIILSSGRPVSSPKIAVNCGSSVSVTSDDVLFQSDSFFNGGEIYEREQNKMNESQRSGEEFSYSFTGLKPLLKYVAVLHFSELEGKKANERIFDVYSQNDLFLESVDIASKNVTSFSQAGVIASDDTGTIQLRFVGLIGNAQVCGIELYLREDVLNGHVTEEGLGNNKRVINTLPKNVLWGYLNTHWYYEHEPYAWRRWGDSSSMGYPTIGGVGYLKGEDAYGSGVTWFWADSNTLTVPPGDYIGKCRWRFESNAQFSENFAWIFDNAGGVDFWAPPYFGQGWIVLQHPSIFRATSTLNTTGFGLYRTPPTSFKRGISIDACWLEKCSNSSCLAIDECSTHASPCNVPDVCTDTETGYTCTPLTPSTPVQVTSNPFVATGHVADSHIMLPGVCGNDYPKGNIVLITGTGADITLSLAVPSGPAPDVHLSINGVLTCQLTFPYTFFSHEGLGYQVYITGATSEYSLTVTHTIIQPKNITTLNYEFVGFVPEATTGSVLLSWDAPPTGNLATSPILEYSVLRNNAPYFTTTSTSIVISGLTKNTVYRFTLYVKTVHFPLSLNTLIPSIRSPTTAPRAPVLVVSGTSATSTVLTWSVADRGGANPAPTNYFLETSEDGVTFPPSGIINTGATAFRTLNWDRATKALYARVRLTVSSGTSDYSNVIYLAPLTPATPPTDLTATVLIEDPNLYAPSVTVTFTPPSDLGGGTLQYYSVLLDDGLGWSYETVVYGSGETAAFEQSEYLGVGDAISVTVAAVTDIVYGDYSDPAIAYAA